MKVQGKEGQKGGFLSVGALGIEDKISARGGGERKEHEPEVLGSGAGATVHRF